MREVVIVSAARTPIGKFRGGLSQISAVALGTTVVKSVLERGKVAPESVDQVILGNVLQAGLGQNPARQVAIHANIPVTSPAMTINEVCGSGLKSIILGKQAIQLGVSDTIVVGGIENMSLSPMLSKRLAKEEQFDESLFVDSLFHDGLTDAFNQKLMGVTAENVADKYNISRAQQDEFANQSQMKATDAWAKGKFDAEIVPVTTPDGSVITQDEGFRSNSSVEKLNSLRTVFKEDGTVTGGNSSTINDGASALVLMAKEVAEARGIHYLATLGEYSEIGNEPDYMGYAPFYAINTLLKKINLTPNDIDLYEINEAFASQSIAVARDLEINSETINIHGGAIALGHPLGATGARIVTTLLHALIAEEKHKGIASLCVGGGIGIALEISRP